MVLDEWGVPSRCEEWWWRRSSKQAKIRCSGRTGLLMDQTRWKCTVEKSCWSGLLINGPDQVMMEIKIIVSITASSSWSWLLIMLNILIIIMMKIRVSWNATCGRGGNGALSPMILILARSHLDLDKRDDHDDNYDDYVMLWSMTCWTLMIKIVIYVK